MDIELIRTFVEVNNARHFGRAAGRLFITQAAVSARIRQLENLLGGRLFDRDPKQVRLTPFGLRFLPHAEQLLAVWHEARSALSETPPPAARYTLGAPPALLESAVPAWLAAQPTDLAFELTGAHPDVLVQALTEGRVDGVFSCGSERPAGIERHRVGSLSVLPVRAPVPGAGSGVRISIHCGREMLSVGNDAANLELPSFTAARQILQERGGESWLPESWCAGFQVTGEGRQLDVAILGGLRLASLFS